MSYYPCSVRFFSALSQLFKDFFFSALANVNILVLAATEMQSCFIGREWSKIIKRK